MTWIELHSHYNANTEKITNHTKIKIYLLFLWKFNHTNVRSFLLFCKEWFDKLIFWTNYISKAFLYIWKWKKISYDFISPHFSCLFTFYTSVEALFKYQYHIFNLIFIKRRSAELVNSACYTKSWSGKIMK